MFTDAQARSSDILIIVAQNYFYASIWNLPFNKLEESNRLYSVHQGFSFLGTNSITFPYQIYHGHKNIAKTSVKTLLNSACRNHYLDSCCTSTVMQIGCPSTVLRFLLHNGTRAVLQVFFYARDALFKSWVLHSLVLTSLDLDHLNY